MRAELLSRPYRSVGNVGPSLAVEGLPNTAMEPSARELTRARRGSSRTLCRHDRLRMVDQFTVEDEIRDVSCNRPHLVILGAGASRAAFPDGTRMVGCCR